MDPTPPNLSSLPTEMLQSILSYIPDAVTLNDIVCSSSACYRAFHGQRLPILETVLQNEFRPGVLPDAFAAYTASILPRRPRVNDSPLRQIFAKHHESQIAKFLEELENEIPTLPPTWTLANSVSLSRLRQHVECFAANFGSQIGLTNVATGATDFVRVSLSETEQDRIRRAFYRYELYCSLFRRSNQFEGSFWVKYAPWEYEQLATVYEYLTRLIGSSFYDVAQHDVEWGYWRVKCREVPSRIFPLEKENPWREAVLSRGLGHLRAIATSSTYCEYREVLGNPSKENCFLEFHFSMPAKDYNCLIADLDEEGLIDLFGPAFTDEDDDGPFRAWAWAYEGHRSSEIYYQNDQYDLRRLGYVMFDWERLDRWDILQRPFEAPKIPGDQKRAIYQAYKLLDDQDEKSQEIRSNLYVDGATGWWNFGDHGFLKWSSWENEVEYNKKRRHQDKMRLISMLKANPKVSTSDTPYSNIIDPPVVQWTPSSNPDAGPAGDDEDIDLEGEDDGDTVWDPIDEELREPVQLNSLEDPLDNTLSVTSKPAWKPDPFWDGHIGVGWVNLRKKDVGPESRREEHLVHPTLSSTAIWDKVDSEVKIGVEIAIDPALSSAPVWSSVTSSADDAMPTPTAE